MYIFPIDGLLAHAQFMHINSVMCTAHILGSISWITRSARQVQQHNIISSTSRTMDDQETEALTAAAVEKRVRDTMMAQQAQLLEIAGRNALELLREEQKKAEPSLMDAVNFEVEAARAYDNHEWKTQVNKNNFDTLYQVEQLWKRTERFVDALEVQGEQADLKTGALGMIEKGKQLVHDRLKLIRFADRDGWQAALHYAGDDIAGTEMEAKKMRKSKKDSDKKKETEKNRREKDTRDRRNNYSSGRSGQGSSRDREPWRGYSHNSNYGGRTDNRFCFHCNRVGHIARNCPGK